VTIDYEGDNQACENKIRESQTNRGVVIEATNRNEQGVNA